jgi:acyl-coenzyme A thioesterase PaaI-like protein
VVASTGKVQAIATVTHAGKRVATAEAKLVVGDKLLASATASCLITR